MATHWMERKTTGSTPGAVPPSPVEGYQVVSSPERTNIPEPRQCTLRSSTRNFVTIAASFGMKTPEHEKIRGGIRNKIIRYQQAVQIDRHIHL